MFVCKVTRNVLILIDDEIYVQRFPVTFIHLRPLKHFFFFVKRNMSSGNITETFKGSNRIHVLSLLSNNIHKISQI